MYAIIIAAFGGHVVSSRFAAKTEYNRHVDAFVAFERFHNLPVPIRKQVDEYCEYTWNRRKTFLLDNVTETLPAGLRAAIDEAIRAKIVAHSRVLRSCVPTHDFVSEFTLLLSSVGICVPGQELFAQGAAVRNLFFVYHGCVELRCNLADAADQGALVVAHRGDGQYCGDQGLFSFSPDIAEGLHEVGAFAATFSDVYAVPAADFLALLGRFPRESVLFEQIAKRRTGARQELVRQYRAAPPPSSRPGTTAWQAQARWTWPQTRQWPDIWLHATSTKMDDNLLDRVISEIPAHTIRAEFAHDDDDDESDLGLIVPRVIQGVYRAIANRVPQRVAPQEAKPASSPPWIRTPASLPRTPTQPSSQLLAATEEAVAGKQDVGARLHQVELQLQEVVGLCRRMEQRQGGAAAAAAGQMEFRFKN
jgi:hypothetical protein